MLSDHVTSILIFAGIDVLMALSFYLPASAGQLSAGQGGFMALGAYTAAWLSVEQHVPFVVTFAFGEMVRVVFLNATIVGGAAGYGGIPAATTAAHVVVIVAVVVYALAR